MCISTNLDSPWVFCCQLSNSLSFYCQKKSRNKTTSLPAPFPKAPSTGSRQKTKMFQNLAHSSPSRRTFQGHHVSLTACQDTTCSPSNPNQPLRDSLNDAPHSLHCSLSLSNLHSTSQIPLEPKHLPLPLRQHSLSTP